MNLTQQDNVKVLLTDANWAWPQAVSEIFQPRGINSLVADSPGDIVNIIDNNKIHLAILDDQIDVQTLKMIRNHNKMMPCLLLAQKIDNRLLAQALKLNIFSVLTKPVNLTQLADQINRIFLKYYESTMFSDLADEDKTNRQDQKRLKPKKTFKAIIRWRTINKNR